MPFAHVAAGAVPAGRGPHPAASPYDKRVGEVLGLTAFEAYQVELPAGAETVRHDHLEDQVEDMYAVVRGHGTLVVGDREVALVVGDFVAVTVEESRYVRAGADGLTIIAVCAAPPAS